MYLPVDVSQNTSVSFPTYHLNPNIYLSFLSLVLQSGSHAHTGTLGQKCCWYFQPEIQFLIFFFF